MYSLRTPYQDACVQCLQDWQNAVVKYFAKVLSEIEFPSFQSDKTSFEIEFTRLHSDTNMYEIEFIRLQSDTNMSEIEFSTSGDH